MLRRKCYTEQTRQAYPIALALTSNQSKRNFIQGKIAALLNGNGSEHEFLVQEENDGKD